MGRTGSTLLTFYFKPRADFRLQIVGTPKDAETRPALFRLASSSHERSTTSAWQVAVAMRSHRRIRSMTSTLQAVRCVIRFHV